MDTDGIVLVGPVFHPAKQAAFRTFFSGQTAGEARAGKSNLRRGHGPRELAARGFAETARQCSACGTWARPRLHNAAEMENPAKMFSAKHMNAMLQECRRKGMPAQPETSTDIRQLRPHDVA